MPRSLFLKLAFLLLSSPFLQGQNKYWVASEYTGKIEQMFDSAEHIICSDWLQTCSYSFSKEEVNQLLDEGVEIFPVLSFEPAYSTAKTNQTVGFALEQIEAQAFLELGLTGKEINIGIIDGGFLNADTEEDLSHFFRLEHVKNYKDFVTPDLENYGGSRGLDDDHGTEVWKLIGGIDHKKKIQFGMATEANYFLARTDHGGFEKRIEEDYFIAALEWLYDQDVRLVNASLGYNFGFTDTKENYHVFQMDGKTSAVAQAVDIAVREKGMLIVVAAGNEGNVPDWKTLSTPGDARFALTVGSSKLKVWDKIDYSSIGPEFIDYVKPDICTFATNGTSYSTPVVTGMIACLWELKPELSNLEVMDIIRKAGHLYPYPNNYLGYGVPTCSKILKILSNEKIEEPKTINTSRKSIRLKSNIAEKYFVAYHKKDSVRVLKREIYRPLGRKVKIKKEDGATQTSLLIDNTFMEIFWE